jgi:hypothetical protein
MPLYVCLLHSMQTVMYTQSHLLCLVQQMQLCGNMCRHLCDPIYKHILCLLNVLLDLSQALHAEKKYSDVLHGIAWSIELNLF